MQITIVVQKKDEPPKLNPCAPLIDCTNIDAMTFCLMEGGMTSGEPSVIIVSEDNEGSIALQTSLDKFLAAAVGLKAAAEGQLGWKEKAGYSTLMPMSKDARKTLLEAMKKELEEWDVLTPNEIRKGFDEMDGENNV